MASRTRQLAARENTQRQIRLARDTKQVAENTPGRLRSGDLWGRPSAHLAH
jgi:hypothetical protein